MASRGDSAIPESGMPELPSSDDRPLGSSTELQPEEAEAEFHEIDLSNRNQSTSLDGRGVRVITGYESPALDGFRTPRSPYSVDLEGEHPPCACCSRNVPCMFFYGQVLFSMLILGIAVAGLSGLMGVEDGCFNSSFYSNLITMVVALWIGRSTGGIKPSRHLE